MSWKTLTSVWDDVECLKYKNMYIYKDKVKVFGDHDENTLEQMLNCYNAGAVDAALMAGKNIIDPFSD